MTMQIKTRSRTGQLLLASTVLSGALGCGNELVECFDDRSCGALSRCNQPNFGQRGTCQPCEPEEIPYDGQDNDCSARTPDSDLDGDGENWVGAPFRSGTDCDDHDRTVRPGLPELCSDQKDNDCDGEIDEKDCADLAAPSVSFLMPVNDELVVGPFTGTVVAHDDVALVELVISMDGVTISPIALGEAVDRTASFEIPGTILRDGRRTLQATVTDLTGKSGTDRINVNVDVQAPPMIEIVRPAQGENYGGTLDIEAAITDPSGVASVQVFLDGVEVSTTTSAQTTVSIHHLLDTRIMNDGNHTLRVIAIEGRAISPATATDEITFAVDNTPPILTVTSPIPNAILMGSVQLAATAVDSSSVEIQVPGAGLSPVPSPLMQTWDTTARSNGATYLDFVAVDHVEIDGISSGHQTTTRIPIEIQNPMPVVPGFRIASPAWNANVWGRTEIDYEYDGNLIDLDGPFRLLVDGVVIQHAPKGASQLALDLTPYVGRSILVEITAPLRNSNVSATGSVVLNVVDVPSFTAPTTFTSNHYDVTILDYDHDGTLDIVTGGATYHGLEFLHGAVAGRRWQVDRSEFIPTAGSSTRLASGTIGGAPAVVAIDYQLCLYRSPREPPPLSSCLALPIPPGTTLRYDDIASGDLDGDGQDEVLLFVHSPTSITPEAPARLFWWNGVTFVPGDEFPDTAGGLVLADVDNDLDLDVVTPAFDGSVLKVFLNQGDGTFLPSIDTMLANPTRELAIADLSGDGIPDVVVEEQPPNGDRGWRLLTAIPAIPGTFLEGAPTPYGLTYGVSSLVARDLNLDGFADLLMAGRLEDRLEIWRGGPAGPTFLNARAVGYGSTPYVQVADLNADGILDAVGHNGGSVSIAYGEPDLSFYAPLSQEYGDFLCRGRDVGNIRGNSPDLVLGTSSSIGVFSVGRNGLENSSWIPYPSGVADLAIGDVLGDAGLEIVATGGSQPTILSYLGAGVFQVEAIGTASSGESRAVVVADLTEDGINDVGFQFRPDRAPGEFSIIDGTSLAEVSRFPMPAMADLVVQEVDRGASDGLDIVGYASLELDFFVVQKFSGAWTTTSPNTGAYAEGALDAHPTDFNGDGFNDYLMCSRDRSRVLVVQNDPVALFSMGLDLGVELPASSNCSQPFLIDIDGDGDDDLLNHAVYTGVSISRNEGNGTFGPVIPLADVDVGGSFLRDVDGDGSLDLVTIGGCTVRIMEQRPF